MDSSYCNCLSADSFANIHNKKSPIAHAHRRFNFSSEVNMPRRVNQVYYKMMFIVLCVEYKIDSLGTHGLVRFESEAESLRLTSDFLLVKENS